MAPKFWILQQESINFTTVICAEWWMTPTLRLWRSEERSRRLLFPSFLSFSQNCWWNSNAVFLPIPKQKKGWKALSIFVTISMVQTPLESIIGRVRSGMMEGRFTAAVFSVFGCFYFSFSFRTFHLQFFTNTLCPTVVTPIIVAVLHDKNEFLIGESFLAIILLLIPISKMPVLRHSGEAMTASRWTLQQPRRLEPRLHTMSCFIETPTSHHW